MRELQLRVECPQISINGHTFDLLLSDLELYTRAQAVFVRCERLANESHTTTDILAAAGEATALLETALGGGAVSAISDGHPVSLLLALEWLSALAREAVEHYTDTSLSDEDAPDAG